MATSRGIVAVSDDISGSITLHVILELRKLAPSHSPVHIEK